MSFAALGAVSSWPRMEARARGLAYELADCHNAATGLCCPSVAYLARRLDTSERTVQRLLRNLEELGVVECHPRFDGQRQTTSTYAFYVFSGEGDKSVTGEGDKIVTGGGDIFDTPEGDKDDTQNQEVGIRKEDSDSQHQQRNGTPYQKIVDLYHEFLPQLRRVEKITAARKSHIQARWKSDLTELDHWRNYFLDVRRSKFLLGQGPVNPQTGKVWRADFDFLIRESSFIKIAEGKYHD